VTERILLTFGAELPPERARGALAKLGIALDIGEGELKDLISSRVDKLSTLLDERGELDPETPDDVVAHLALRMVSAADESKRIETWFLNNECAALRSKLSTLQRENHAVFLEAISPLLFCDRIQYMRDYSFGRDGREIARGTGVDPESILHIVVDWKGVPRSVSSGKCILYRGIAVLEKGEASLISQAVKNYELLLRKKISDLASGMTVEKIRYYENFGSAVVKDIKSTSTAFVGIEDLSEELMLFPPCIVGLDGRISQGFEVEHLEFLQLGFFLREAGLSFRDYQRYWYLRHPSNRGRSWEEFISSHWGSYQLRHHYGEMGGGKRYNAFSCKKAQSDAACPFRDLGEEDLTAFLLSYLDDRYEGEDEKRRLEKEINHILSLKGKRYYGAACATEFKLRFKSAQADWVNHPIYNYYHPAKVLDRERKKKETEAVAEDRSEGNGGGGS
jgi:DNA primase large subunit